MVGDPRAVHPEATIEPVVRRPATSMEFTGRYPFGFRRWAYVPFDVPPGTRRIRVRVRHERFAVPGGLPGNVLDLGLFGPAGWEVGNAAGFRGWSGGARSEVEVAEGYATPGYLAGPIEAGTWAVALGPVVLNPRGMRWWLAVTLDDRSPAPAPGPRPVEPPARRGPGWYRGDLHLHTVHSDGQRQPAGLVRAARDAGLDFVVSTEHNTSAAHHADWPAGGVLVIPGEEVTTRYGHWLAVGLPPGAWVDWRYRPGDGWFDRCARAVRAGGGLVVAAHPAVPVPCAAWEFGYRQVDAVEVWNGRWTPDDEVALRVWDRLLRRGRRLVAVGGSDAHAEADPVGRPQTVVHATGLSTVEVLAGLRLGRCYLAGSAGVTLTLEAGCGAGPGQDAAVPVEVRAEVRGAPRTRLALHSATGVVARTAVGESGVGAVSWVARDAAATFVRAEVRRDHWARSMVALTNPIWLRPGAAGP